MRESTVHYFLALLAIATLTALCGELTGDAKNSDCLLLTAVLVGPCVGAFRFWMADKLEHFNRSFPRGLSLENFFDRNGFYMKRFAAVRRSDGIFKLCNLFSAKFLQSERPLLRTVGVARPQAKELVGIRRRS